MNSRPSAWWLLVPLLACSRNTVDSAPEGAVRAWVEFMDQSADNRAAMSEAYALLGPRARENLQERARRTSQLHGRRVDPSDMLAEGWFGLRFQPKQYHATISGDHASVTIEGLPGSGAKSTVRCVRENGRWRVEPELPPLPELPKRDGGL